MCFYTLAKHHSYSTEQPGTSQRGLLAHQMAWLLPEGTWLLCAEPEGTGAAHSSQAPSQAGLSACQLAQLLPKGWAEACPVGTWLLHAMTTPSSSAQLSGSS
uniref:Uncharacterized protein n=1 Tax=Sphaerodactylus townsendi TaxID=933632 RepID=A0ACB8F2U5_9SAUR